MSRNYFSNRIAVLATMHRKEKAIAPILQEQLGVQVIVPPDFNTDDFGTFTRERERPGTQLETARLKAQKILEQTGATLALASEGSFGPHPGFPMLACDRELVLLLDTANDLELVGEELSAETNYQHRTIRSLEEALKFAQAVGFPEHGLIVMTSAHSKQPDEITKGITTPVHLEEAVERALRRSPTGTIHIETDMRALYNPTRMQAIARATLNLVQIAQRACPQCDRPGFAPSEYRKGLPCDWCGLPTRLTRSILYQCQTCHYQQESLFPEGMETADPAQCQYCNP
ncbi:DUF6671 family protein [Leptodesmis sichuanensis]|uniref:DUF6671 family protein n=1 Tax=Leptodesmis sichuanensis TaxID=2906798 RepID=UPI001F382DEA|nr:DUF6671 family protein [Leptodesmis sichuanensis]UIE39283.1 hypothetical protein KIK02_06805 [Leptodesmis sichuanensis A121]